MSLLASSKLSTRLPTNDLSAIERLGQTTTFRKNQHVFKTDESVESLFFILKGKIIVQQEESGKPAWLSTGDFLGEEGFFLGGSESATAIIETLEATLFCLPRSVLSKTENLEILTKLIVALSPYVQIRKTKRSTDFQPSSTVMENHCDHEHSEIVATAKKLAGSNQWETAINIWRFVRQTPYRFGYWDLLASQTLAMGCGMCTSKANLHAALLRASGLQAAFVELKIKSLCVSLLLPEEYRADVREYIKHYFCAVFLDGKWFPCDASFTKTSMKMVTKVIPELDQFAEHVFCENQPYNFAAESEDKSPFDFTPLPNLNKIMGKKPYYDEDNMEAMNIELDKVQGFRHPLQPWAQDAEDLLSTNIALAFHTALNGLSQTLSADVTIPVTQVDVPAKPATFPASAAPQFSKT